MADSSLRLRPFVSLMLFISAYAPLMLIILIKQVDFNMPYYLNSPIVSLILLIVAVSSSVITILTAKSVRAGLMVTVSKASNKSGDMFGYTIPYMLSFMRIDLSEWQTITAIILFLSVLFIMAYRTQTVFINPILAISGYMLIDCTFKRQEKEIQAMVITREPISAGDSVCLDRLSHYLYIRSQSDYQNKEESV
ncbi:hypothetical protein BBH51_10265 [Aggregatibacter actinomycetemcomitans]|uniref:Uncharacterized protein n=1 Tax=Aggregatibacter actinomycetemcomitans TaxID=714 RepID=A0AB74N5Q7_AGGAC|nr:hypothetical protein [Aggregatibacter actinomycetemcomitans]ANN81709.1 hypothetical protein D7S_03605 [Aggregatibacter actinomycetemcomitans D7S-1]ANU83000.1 hypothetical protein BBH51_10265 [Aggregatibacter actinomycetemcomitans]KND85753.1 hypothetical protein H5P1_0201785 [Aggregatibacter actinomycetemcomitans serotype a str. H5P1]KOE30640.1 hypothetical protein D17P3_0308640 [Aggregatibacter actinomycetemcomitans D17P-3]KOE63528.1 hypothetical protein A160_0208870 [Aggregatibacter actino